MKCNEEENKQMAKADLVVLSKNQADALEEVRRYSAEDILKAHRNEESAWKGKAAQLNSLSFDDLARALYVGYIVEKTQEEREADIKSWYDYLEKITHASLRLSSVDKRADGMKSGIKGTLRRLGITIEGVSE